jgi:hypothetical protein
MRKPVARIALAPARHGAAERADGFIPDEVAHLYQRQESIELHALPFESPTAPVTQVWHRRHDQDAANQLLRGLAKRCLGDA